jgi:subtilisin family serine protease
MWRGEEITHRADRVIVKIHVEKRRPDVEGAHSTAEQIAASVEGAQVHRLSTATGTLVLSVPEGTDIVAVAEELSRRPDVVHAAPDRVTSVTVTPSDTRYGEQWAFPKISAEPAWDVETGQNGILIAVLDTGISWQNGALTHPDLDDSTRYLLGTDFVSDDAIPQDGFGHGTHVAGTAAAESNNAQGVAGMNWVSQVYVCKVFDDFGSGSESDFQAAVEEVVDYAVANNLKVVINLSARWLSDSTTLSDACDYVDSHGMLLCVATGNDSSAVAWPAAHSADFEGVVAVGATDDTDTVASFSNTGPAVNVVAPGVGILSTFPTYDVNGDTAHDYVSWDGTSMATPHVTGLASLVWSKVPQLTNSQVRDVLENTAVRLGSGSFDNAWGHGRVNAVHAVTKAGWDLTPVQLNLTFLDVPEGETQLRAVRIDVKSFHTTSFDMSVLPSAPFAMHNYSGPIVLGKTTDYDTPREVYLWVRYTGTTAGDVANGTAQARCVTTGQLFDITITANTISRPTAAMVLVLDRSGSMLEPSGVGTMTREQVLRFSAGIAVDYVRQGNALGMVTFDQDAHDLLVPVAGPFGAPDDPFDAVRSSARTALSSYAANPIGLTAIGDGIERGHNVLGAASGYDKTALIVFTDGFETAPQYISDVTALINNEVFAVGLGTANELEPAALNDICNDHGGYLLLTDALNPDDTFKVAKYFLQIQAGVNNEDVVVDPDGYVAPGQKIRIPFVLSEADISADAIALLPFHDVLDVAVETPQGNVIDEANVAGFPTVARVDRPNMTYYRMTLPVDDGASVHAHAGTWHLVLTVDPRIFKQYLSVLRDGQEKAYRDAVAHGVQYTALVHAYSNLRMSCSLSQHSYQPGATMWLRCLLTEYGQPLQGSASVRAVLTRPDGSTSTLPLAPMGPGTYEASVVATLPGVYRFVVSATGSTSRHTPFTREQVVTGAVWRGGDTTPPHSNGDSPGKTVCHLLGCLARSMSPALRERLVKEGWSVDELLKCTCR